MPTSIGEAGARYRGVRFTWYLRIGLYLAVLIAMAIILDSLRGRIPMAFGLTPIQVKALSVERVPYGGGDSAGVGMTDVSVSIRIVGNDPLPDGVALSQFRLVAKGNSSYEPYASTFLFDSTGKLRIAPGDTLFGALVFALPSDERPAKLWWRP